ncbi:MICOS complex subunit MIC27 isoform X4 [Oryctolagus cuniculus]
MGKLTATPVGLIYASINVRAIKEEESPKHLVRPEQLPIYAAPPLRSKYIDEQPGHLQMGFASIRKRVGRYVGWCKGVYVFVKNGITDTVQFGKDAYVYVKNPPRDFLPKIGVITASGLAGVISARKGSRFKKIAYPLGLTTLGATVCYPVQSVIIAKVTVKKAYATSQQIFESVKSWWTKSNKKDSLPEPKEKPKLESSAEIEVPGKATRVLTYSVPLSTELNSSETKTKSELPSDLFEIQGDSQRASERGKDIFHLLFHSLNGRQQPGLGQAEARSQELHRVSHVLHSFCLTPSSWITGSPIQKM